MDNNENNVLRSYHARVGKINARERQTRAMSDKQLLAVTDELRARLRKEAIEGTEAQAERKPIPFRASRKKDAPDDRR